MSEPSSERQSEARQAAEEYERSKAELDAAIREHKKATEAQRHAYGQAALLPAAIWASSFGPVGEVREPQEISTR